MRRVLVIVVVLARMTATAGSAATRTTHGPLTGTWTGVLTGTVNGQTRQQRITFAINAMQTGGTWKVSSSCHGGLVLVSISDGYHHYRRHVAAGSTCAAGDIDCLQRSGTQVYDSVTPRPNGWSRSGMLHRVITT